MFLDTVVYEDTRFNEKVILNKRKPSNTHALSLKQRLTGKVFQILKKTLDGQRVPTQFENKIAIRNK